MLNMPIIGITCGRQGENLDLRCHYVKALANVGLAAVILPPHACDIASFAALARKLDGLLLSGGGDPHPQLWNEQPNLRIGNVDRVRDEYEINLLRAFLAENKPIMGICRGMQLLNVAQGGTLWQDLQERGGNLLHMQTAAPEQPWHSVKCQGLTAHLLNLADNGEIYVNSCHHQGVRALGKGVVAEAWAPDGLIEGIRLSEYRFAVGVQWHPERLADNSGIWQGFATACQQEL
jgi:putative glutamine amidotransferase